VLWKVKYKVFLKLGPWISMCSKSVSHYWEDLTCAFSIPHPTASLYMYVGLIILHPCLNVYLYPTPTINIFNIPHPHHSTSYQAYVPYTCQLFLRCVSFLSWECWDFWRRQNHFRKFRKKSKVFQRSLKSSKDLRIPIPVLDAYKCELAPSAFHII